jgi:GxxExxY protein
VHRELGPGLLESAYEEGLCYELGQAGLRYQRQQELPVHYKGRALDLNYRMDVVVEQALVVELKAVDALQPIHDAQLITYLKLSGIPLGLLVNFNVPILKHGIRRLVHNYHGPGSPNFTAK